MNKVTVGDHVKSRHEITQQETAKKQDGRDDGKRMEVGRRVQVDISAHVGCRGFSF
jgi:hypothetical protein